MGGAYIQLMWAVHEETIAKYQIILNNEIINKFNIQIKTLVSDDVKKDLIDQKNVLKYENSLLHNYIQNDIYIHRLNLAGTDLIILNTTIKKAHTNYNIMENNLKNIKQLYWKHKYDQVKNALYNFICEY